MADRDRFLRMAQTYGRMCRSMVPGYDFLRDEILARVRRGADVLLKYHLWCATGGRRP